MLWQVAAMESIMLVVMGIQVAGGRGRGNRQFEELSIELLCNRAHVPRPQAAPTSEAPSDHGRGLGAERIGQQRCPACPVHLTDAYDSGMPGGGTTDGTGVGGT